MSFSFGGTGGGFSFNSNNGGNKQQGFSFGNTSATTTATTTGGLFSSSFTAASGTTAAGGFSFNTSQSTTSAPTNLFGSNLSGSISQPAFGGTGIGSIGTPQQKSVATTANTGFSFSSKTTNATTSSAAPSINFGGIGQSSSSSGLFQLGGTKAPNITIGMTSAGAQTTAATPLGSGFGSFVQPTQQTSSTSQATTSATQATIASGFAIAGSKSIASAPSLGAVSLGGTSTAPLLTGGFSLKPKTTAATTTAPSTAFSLTPQSTTAGTTALSFGKSAPVLSTKNTTTSAPTGLSFGLKSTTASSTSLKLTVTSTATTTASSGFKLNTTTTSSTSLGVTSTTTTAPSLTYNELEAKVNQWTAELEQQEKLFLTQATHVNAWNKVLIENAEKIMELNDDFTKVELDQKRLNQELDYIKTEQNELEEILKPLEENIQQQTAALSSSLHTHHADLERERTYNLAENIDGQLKRMVQDLREVIDHINSNSEPVDTNNPITQVGKILSAHMDSLHWLDGNSVALSNKVHELSSQVEGLKREQEGKFRLAFN